MTTSSLLYRFTFMSFECHFNISNCICLIISGYAGSPLLCGFPLAVVSGATLWLQWPGFSLKWLLLLRSMGSRPCMLQWLWLLGSRAVPQHVGSSRIGDWIHVSYTGRWIPYPWVTREATAGMLNHLPCPALRDPVDRSPPGSSVHRDSPGMNIGVGCQALLQWISPPGTEPLILVSPALASGCFPMSATWEAWGSHYFTIQVMPPNFFLLILLLHVCFLALLLVPCIFWYF